MLTKLVDVGEVQNHLKELLSLASTGTEVIVTEGDKPLARLVPLESPSEIPTTPRITGLHPGAIWMSDDFDDPLPDEFWLGES